MVCAPITTPMIEIEIDSRVLLATERVGVRAGPRYHVSRLRLRVTSLEQYGSTHIWPDFRTVGGSGDAFSVFICRQSKPRSDVFTPPRPQRDTTNNLSFSNPGCVTGEQVDVDGWAGNLHVGLHRVESQIL